MCGTLALLRESGNSRGFRMKKTVLFIALAAGSLSLAACKKEADAPAPVEATSEAAPEAMGASSEAAPAASTAADASAATSEAAK